MSSTLVDALRSVVGVRHVLTGETQTRRFRRGYRYGGGDALAVVRPGTLVEMWSALKLVIEAGHVVIFQAANTGLTGGSTPQAEGYDRPVVIISTLRLNHMALIREGQEVVCQPGVTLERLEAALAPIGREPHSVIGSTCIGATVTGGICNNSGGALVRRGPAYTQMALYARVTREGKLELFNNLGIALGDTPEEMLRRLDEGRIDEAAVTDADGRWGSDRDYASHVRDVTASSPARYNADPRRLYEASGSAGHLAVFALRLDTFAADRKTRVFYIGSRDPAELATIRADILTRFEHLPIAGEYMHSSAYDASRRYGKDLFLFIRTFGARHVPKAYAWKGWFDAVTARLGMGTAVSDRILQWITDILPNHLPPRMEAFRARYPHHLLIKVGDDGVSEASRYFAERFPTADGDFFECTETEAQAAFLTRFAVGGAIVRYRAVHPRTVEDIVALDIALPRNATDWLEVLPPEIEEKLEFKMYCGHFLCHVLHQEYLVRKGEDCDAVKDAILSLLTQRGAKYPAEHNVGHLYAADEALAGFYRELDPTNSFNPGVGKTSKRLHWGCNCSPQPRNA